MKLTVFGASGGTGLHILRQAIERGYEVTAVVRDAGRLPSAVASGVDVAEADVLAGAGVEETVKGRDAVLTAIGTRDRSHPVRVCADSARTIITAMGAAARDARLVIASNSAMSPGPGDDPLTRYLVKPVILHRILRYMLDDMRQAEQHVRDCGLPWAIVRAGRLTDRPGKGRYRHAIDRNVPGGFQITRADFATAMLDAAADPASLGHVISASN
jgi:putative NADH-flavin reductase